MQGNKSSPMDRAAREPASGRPGRAFAALALAGLLAAPPAWGSDEGGARQLFVGSGNPQQVQATGVRPTARADATSAPPPAAAAGPGSPGLRVWLTDAAEAAGRKLSPQSTFRTGDRFRLWLQSNRDGFIYLVNVGTSGTARLMFPRANQDNRISRFKDFAMGSPLVFHGAPGTEQLVVVLSSTEIEDTSIQLASGKFVKVPLKPGSSAPLVAAKPREGRDAASESLDLALADLRGAKDLKFEDDGNELVTVSQKTEARAGSYEPVVVNLRLTHR